MKLTSLRIITNDVTRLAEFYALATGLTVNRLNEDFAEVGTPLATLAVASARTLALYGADVAEAASNRSAIIEFLVDDVEACFERLQDQEVPVVQKPTTMPWGNRSLLLRDPDGHLVNFFTPVTPQARAKFGLS